MLLFEFFFLNIRYFELVFLKSPGKSGSAVLRAVWNWAIDMKNVLAMCTMLLRLHEELYSNNMD